MNGRDDRRRRFGPFTIDNRRRQVYRAGRPVPISGKAFDLLSLLVDAPGKAFSRDELYDLLWPSEAVEDANLTQNIYLLRRALDPDGDGRSFIKTIPRYGYSFAHALEDPEQPPRRTLLRPLVSAALVILIVVVLASSSGVAHARLPQHAAEAQALGEYHLSLRGPDDLRTALRYFRTAIAAAPDDAAACAGAASAVALGAEYQPDGSRLQNDAVRQASALVHQAFARDPRSSQALAIDGFISYRFYNDYAAAQRLLEDAIAQDPGNAAAHHWFGVVALAGGDLQRATHEFETAHAQQPTSEVFSRWLARSYMLAGRADEAIAAAKDALRIAPGDAAANLVLASAEEQRGRLNDALHIMQSLGARAPYEQRYVVPSEARVRHLMHRVARISSAGRLDPFETALFYVSIGDQRHAAVVLRNVKRTRLERALEAYDPRLKRFKLDEPLRQLLTVTG